MVHKMEFTISVVLEFTNIKHIHENVVVTTKRHINASYINLLNVFCY